MNRCGAFISLALPLLLAGFVAGEDNESTKQIGILSFENVISPAKVSSADLGAYRVDPRYDYLEKALTDMITSDLSTFSSVRLVERLKIEKLLEEIRFQESGAVDERTTIGLGAAAGAQVLIYGLIDKQKNNIVIKPRIVDVGQRVTTRIPDVSSEDGDELALEQKLTASIAKVLDLRQSSATPALDISSQEPLAVLPFYNNSKTVRRDRDGMGFALADMAVYHLLKKSRVKIIERAKIESVLKEHGLQQTGVVDERTAVRLGKLLGARSLLVGTFFENKDKIRVDARIVAVETGRTLVLGSVCVPKEELSNGINRLLVRLQPIERQ